MKHWAKNLKDEVAAEAGWKLVGKVLAGVIGAAAAVVSVLSFLDTQQEAQDSHTSDRMAAIQTGLVSDSVATRIAALKNLMTFASEQTPPRTGDARFRGEVFSFPRSALLDAIEAAKEVPPDAGTDQPSPALGQRERMQLLQALAQMGSLGWSRPQPPRHKNAPAASAAMEFGWTANSENALSVEGIPKPATVLNGFPFDDLHVESARFDCSDLENAGFPRADIEQSSFQGADVPHGNFRRALISFSRFHGSNLNNSTFDDARITGAYFNDGPDVCGAAATSTQIDRSSLRRVEINDSDFSGASLLGTVADDAFISGTNFDAADASGLRLARSNLSGVSFRKSTLDGAIFDRAVLSSVKFDGANLRNASFFGVTFQDPQTWRSLFNADVTAANFMAAKEIPQWALCQLVRKGAVLVEDVERWNKQGRPARGVASGLQTASTPTKGCGR